MTILYMFMLFYYVFFKLIGFVQNKGVYSALKKYPGLYLFSKKKTKIKKWEPQNDLIFFFMNVIL